MKKKNFLMGHYMPKTALAILAIGIFIFSCKKENIVQQPTTSSLSAVSGLLEGTIITGPVTCTADENDLYISLEGNGQILFLDKLPGFKTSLCNSIANAEVLSSKYGCVVKDLSSGKVWLFPNNDAESLDKFQEAKSRLAGNKEMQAIFGNTIVNISNT